MSTRALYIFKDADEMHAVYKHHDGYPSGAAEMLIVAHAMSWQGGRFEPDEAAASFVTAGKLHDDLFIKDGKLAFKTPSYSVAGDVRLMKPGTKKNIFSTAPCDINYAYVISPHPGSGWYVEAYETSFWEGATPENANQIWVGPLVEMAEWANKFVG